MINREKYDPQDTSCERQIMDTQGGSYGERKRGCLGTISSSMLEKDPSQIKLEWNTVAKDIDWQGVPVQIFVNRLEFLPVS